MHVFPISRVVRLLIHAQVAIFYLVITAVAGSAFILCSYWMYRYVDAETDLDFEFDDQEPLFQQPSALAAADDQFCTDSARAIAR